MMASETKVSETAGIEVRPGSLQLLRDNTKYRLIYHLALVASVSLWLVAIHAPLWQDETVSFWQINAGFSHIWSRLGLSPFAYPYILWLATKTFGTSELALRIPSILAMLGAVYLLYRAAGELFDRDIAVIVAVVFCLHPLVIIESIDARPYPFVMLVANAAIFALVRLRRSDSNWLAALFGVAAAGIIWFHLLSIVILPALALCFLLSKPGNTTVLRRQFAIAFAAFGIAFLPVVPGLLYMFHSRAIHVYDKAPTLWDLARPVMPVAFLFPLLFVLFGAFVAIALRRNGQKRTSDPWRFLLCVSVAFVPLLTLYFVSTRTSLHIFVLRYELIAVPGIALFWGLILNTISLRWLRVAFCVSAVAIAAHQYLRSPESRRHLYTWKYALDFAERNASSDNAPIVICSDLPEADYMPMPTGSVIKDSTLFSNITYYKLTVPVVPLPRALNEQAIQLGSDFLQEATQKRERFLALAFRPSYKTLNWLTQQASGRYKVHDLGTFDGVKVLAFVPVTKS